MLRRLVRAEHAEHAGCDGSLGNLTGCIEVLLLPVVLLLLLLLLLPLLLRVRRAVCGQLCVELHTVQLTRVGFSIK